MAGRVAVVTGAGRGIGRAIALAYAREAATVLASAARSTGELDSLEEDAVGLPGRVLTHRSDVTDPSDAEALVAAAMGVAGRIDVLVNNAARGMRFVNEGFMTEPLPFWKADPAAWRAVMRTNIDGVFNLTRLVVPHMLANGSGSVINVTINEATMVRKGFSPYGPSKAALEAMTHVWARELEGSGVRINLLLPGGATDTGMVPAGVPSEIRSGLLRPEIMGEPAVWLAVGEAHDQRVVAKDFSPAP